MGEGVERREFLAQSAAGLALLLGSCKAPRPAKATEEAMDSKAFRKKLLECLGGPWPQPCELRPRKRKTLQKEGYRIESLTYAAEPDDRIPAMLLVPDGVDANHPAPAVAIWHQHNGQYHLGKSEPAECHQHVFKRGDPPVGADLRPGAYSVTEGDTIPVRTVLSPSVTGECRTALNFRQVHGVG